MVIHIHIYINIYILYIYIYVHIWYSNNYLLSIKIKYHVYIYIHDIRYVSVFCAVVNDGRSAAQKRAVELHAIGIEDRFVAVRVAGAAPRHPGIQKCKQRYRKFP